jgi:hypothetical protein
MPYVRLEQNHYYSQVGATYDANILQLLLISVPILSSRSKDTRQACQPMPRIALGLILQQH